MIDNFTDGQKFDEEAFDAFVEMLGYELSKPKIHAFNLRRTKELENAYNAISKIVLGISPDAKIECRMHELRDGSASIRIETDEFVVEDIKAFISGVENANNFEIYPIKNGKVRMAIMFQDIMKEVPLK